MGASVAFLGGAALAFCQWLIIFYAPGEREMGLAQKIFYLHLPCAWWGLASFFVVFLASAAYLLRPRAWLAWLARAACETGLVLAALALATGMIWGRLAWGVWWTWDPRLTATLVMCLIYGGYMALAALPMPQARKAPACAVLGVAAFLDVPLVFFSARLWRSIHPAVFATGGGLDADMAWTLGACLAALGLFWGALLAIRARQLALEAAISSLEGLRMARTLASMEDA